MKVRKKNSKLKTNGSKKEVFSTTYFHALTGLRAVGALMIFTHHFINQFNPPLFLRGFFQEFYVGVTFFFVLSGFLIGLKYSNTVLNSPRSIIKFYLFRLIRIYPLYAVLVIYVFLKLQTTNPVLWVTNLTLTHGLFDNLKFSGIAPAWALTVEATFYLLFPLIIFFNKKIPLILQAVSCVIVGGLLVTIFKNNPYTFFANYQFMLLYTFLGRAFEFLMGVYLARNLTKISGMLQPLNALHKLIKIPITYLSIIALGIVVYGLSLLAKPEYGGLGFFHPYGTVVHNIILPITVASLIFGLIREQTIIRKLLSTPTFQTLGASSYAFYLLHYSWIFKSLGDNFYIRLMVVTITSIIVYKVIEQPIHTKLYRVIKKL